MGLAVHAQNPLKNQMANFNIVQEIKITIRLPTIVLRKELLWLYLYNIERI